MRKNLKTKTNERSGSRARRAALKNLAETELAVATRRRENFLNFAPLHFCALALKAV